MPVRFDELLQTLEWVSFDSYPENEAYVSRATGRIYWINDVEENLPEDLEDGTKYLCIPRKRDLDLGKRLALDFVRQVLPADYGAVSSFFKRRGAYRRYKDFLERKNKLEDWYSFEEAATKRALREWANEHDLPICDR
jgi:hypothetical protein